MVKQIEFTLNEIGTKEKKKDGDIEETKTYKYVNILLDIEIKVKGTDTADNNGFPTGTIGDKVIIDVGATNKQTKIE